MRRAMLNPTKVDFCVSPMSNIVDKGALLDEVGDGFYRYI